jgi:hypothetical protein
VNCFEGFAKAGRIHSHREYFANTGSDTGFMIVEDEVSELMAIVAEDETVKLNSEAAAIIQDFQIMSSAAAPTKPSKPWSGRMRPACRRSATCSGVPHRRSVWPAAANLWACKHRR